MSLKIKLESLPQVTLFYAGKAVALYSKFEAKNFACTVPLLVDQNKKQQAAQNNIAEYVSAIRSRLTHVWLVSNEQVSWSGCSFAPSQPATDMVREARSAWTIILLHGGALSGRMYEEVVPLLLGRGYQVQSPDLPGHGSMVESGQFSFAASRELLLRKIEDMGTQVQKKLLLVGVSLGGQVVLDLIAHYPNIAAAVVVSGVPIHPPDNAAQWEMPHMPSSERWMSIIMADVEKMGMSAANAVQAESFAFQFEPQQSLPPVLVIIGEKDVAMARRDFEELYENVKMRNDKSQRMVLKGAWHNHPIDVPEDFAETIHSWIQSCFPEA